MRTTILLAGAAITLSACGDSTAPQSAGSVATTSGSGSTTDTFVSPSTAHTYAGIGAVQHYEYYTQSNANGQGGELYAGDAGTARDGGFTIAYDPRDAIFDITITRAKGDVSTGDMRFQDPQMRTNFGGLLQPQAGTPNAAIGNNQLAGIQYLQSGSSSGTLLSGGTLDNGTGNTQAYPVGANGYTSTTQTFFYQKPGTTTQYVTYAGFLQNTLSVASATDANGNTYLKNSYSLNRAVFAWGQQTDIGAVPKSGSASYTGDVLGTMVFNNLSDTTPGASTYFQWLTGSQTTAVDFGKLTISTSITGSVTAPTVDAYTNGVYSIPGGSTFAASATGTIDLVSKGGFSGSFSSATFTTPSKTAVSVAIAGSSIDGAFYGPNAEEVGGSFRVVGGTPDQRIDILGAFTGKK